MERLAYLRPDDTRPVAPLGWVHGDFHDLNLLWSSAQSSRITAVLDWDRLRLGPLAADVVRTATLIFAYELTPELRALDLERVAAFTAGYHEVTSPTDAPSVVVGTGLRLLAAEVALRQSRHFLRPPVRLGFGTAGLVE